MVPNQPTRLTLLNDRLEDIRHAFQGQPEGQELIQFAELFLLRLSFEALAQIPSALFIKILQGRFRFYKDNLEEDLIVLTDPIKAPGLKNAVIFDLMITDRPFVVDSINEYLYQKGYSIFLFAHPVISRKSNELSSILEEVASTESRTHALITLILDNFDYSQIAQTQRDFSDILHAVMRATEDFPELRDDILALAQQNGNSEVEMERKKLFEWLLEDNAILLGSVAVSADLASQGFEWEDLQVPKGLVAQRCQRQDVAFVALLNRYAKYFVNSGLGLNIFELPENSLVHRNEPILMLLANRITEDGTPLIQIILLLFTSKGQQTSASAIPTARVKIQYVTDLFAGSLQRHLHKSIDEFYTLLPKGEIFRMDRTELMALLEQLQFYREFRLPKLFVYWVEERGYLRLTLCLSAKRFNKDLFDQLAQLVASHFGEPAEIQYFVPFARNVYGYFVLWSPNLAALNQVAEIESKFQLLALTWEEELDELLKENPEIQESLTHSFCRCFPDYYQALYTPAQAHADITAILRLLATQQEQVDLRSTETEQSSKLSLFSTRLYKLTELMPKLLNLSLVVSDENFFTLTLPDQTIYLYQFDVEHHAIPRQEYSLRRERFIELFNALQLGQTENDELNGLLFQCGFSLKQINLFILYRNYLLQLGSAHHKSTLNQALLSNPEVVQRLWDLFEYRFEPEGLKNKEQLQQFERDLTASIFQVHTLAEDVIFKGLKNLILATVRTNYFLRSPQMGIAIKVQSAQVEHMPLPKPLFEIYVHGPEMEGIHLRGAKIARGGIRHSDRPDDFRTEVLGLMKTQMMKNVVIVPEGSKGGFVLKKPVTDRAQMMAEGKKQYQVLMDNLLSLTDNIINGKVQQRQDLICYDEADPYLVVAADKGTAHLSDTANEISIRHNFWLNDAFASGGSNGYDHKKMGITARGAWECVKNHFLEMGFDTQTQPFRVIGIGDMAGDVFGNGMLLSEQIQLIGAFNHVHIFLDPNPNPATSFAERKRLFETPGSSWLSYDAALISAGGGVFERSAKRILLSPEVQQMLDTPQSEATGEELIRLLLKAPADLLWNGGIGTYVKSSQESHQQAGDATNDNVRINADELRVKVVGEGGNLGFTQKARVEFNQLGGKINTDAIDNSAGVDTSDHEVNLKILLHAIEEQGHLNSAEERNQLLHSLTQEVADLVLQDNLLQCRIISMDQVRSKNAIQPFLNQIDHLSRIRLLDRRTENISYNKQLQQSFQQGLGMPRPDLAILLSYTKMHFYKEILASRFLEDPFLLDLYLSYYPPSLQAQFPLAEIPHPLHKEIVATVWTNQMINSAGVTLQAEIQEIMPITVVDLMVGYTLLNHLLNVKDLRTLVLQEIGSLNMTHAYPVLIHIENRIKWLLLPLLFQNQLQITGFGEVAKWKNQLQSFLSLRSESLTPVEQEQIQTNLQRLTPQPLSQGLGQALLRLELASSSLVVIQLAEQHQITIQQAFELEDLLNRHLCFNQIEVALLNLKELDEWQLQHRGLLLRKLFGLRQRLAGQILSQPEGTLAEQMSGFLTRQPALSRIPEELGAMQSGPNALLSGLTVLLSRFELQI